MAEKKIITCKRCIMNNESDETISFDSNGYCNYCSDALKRKNKVYFPNEKGKNKLDELLKRIKNESAGNKYDCVMGISGGLDSSYLLYLGHLWNLRILAIHIDDGYDTKISQSNIKKLIDKTGVDYEVVSPDKEQYNDLVLSYMKAGVPNIATPQDNILFTYIFKKVKEYHIKYFLSGTNFALESILQKGNTYTVYDKKNIFDINNKFGKTKLDKLELMSIYEYYFNRVLFNYKVVTPLDYIDYNRNRAFAELKEFCGFEYYGRKHLENILTAFIQLYWFPVKFHVDKRRSHLSSMIISDQLTREAALSELDEKLYDEKLINEYIDIIAKNMHVQTDEIYSYINSENHKHTDYKNIHNDLIFQIMKFIYKKLFT